MSQQVLSIVRREGLRLAGAALAAASCIPMLAMLPGGVVTVLALLGITATAAPVVGLGAFLAPIAQPLLILSVGMLVLGHLRCGWPPALLAAIGGLLVYLAMYVFVIPVPVMDHATMEDMTGMPVPTAVATPMDEMAGMNGMSETMSPMTGSAGMTNEPLFYLGLASLVSSFGLAWWRQHKHICQRIYLLPALRSIIARRF